MRLRQLWGCWVREAKAIGEFQARLHLTIFYFVILAVKDVSKELLPAITHVDGSARIQTVRAKSAPLYHQLLEEFGQATGVPVLMNTSFNLRGEPIVTTPAEAFSTFSNSGLDFLVLGSCLITKT